MEQSSRPNIITIYAINYPFEHHEDIAKILESVCPHVLFDKESPIRVRFDCDNAPFGSLSRKDCAIKPNRAFIYAIKTRSEGICGAKEGSQETFAYLNFYPMELKKIEMANQKTLSELNTIYDALIEVYDPATFHLGWVSFIA
jgi:hypothetical protein